MEGECGGGREPGLPFGSLSPGGRGRVEEGELAVGGLLRGISWRGIFGGKTLVYDLVSSFRVWGNRNAVNWNWVGCFALALVARIGLIVPRPWGILVKRRRPSSS